MCKSDKQKKKNEEQLTLTDESVLLAANDLTKQTASLTDFPFSTN